MVDPRDRYNPVNYQPEHWGIIRATMALPLALYAFLLLCSVVGLPVVNAAATPPPLPVEQNATCGADKVVYTRHEIWTLCFMRLGGMEAPRPGQLNVDKVSKFRADHLYPWERWFTPSAAEIVTRCDQPPRDGWITQEEFEGTTTRLCLADADAICHTRDVCERETRHLNDHP
jgi:hypothetical protein